MDDGHKVSQTIIGLAAAGAALIGVVSLIAALFPFFNGDYAAAGFCLIASGISFGLLANAVFRR